ncbi:23S rRNA (guanosine(2251)-2'-O)-methyltransferase RlmB [Nannocystis bainbridge]|uniref:23S rRNA (Guanosine(2251)-2'-O)-methyltransferase RlmB n=1 Tax=Nannocystis bainbridge TaxID=2995303 RepID=A0ABT5DZ80_9BACT|nr:23S rRNA (guanosine(2251)-2'-O)-methyltransferase RlmB [Nannocystis bainbridge]MDC0718932.1 23S rRNA (guanosine(2251)-2'-O)-methyltransferase RlmB [Nannocystis bainbridge]
MPGERAVVELLRGAPARVRRILVLPGHELELRRHAPSGVTIDVCTLDAIAAVISPELARGVVAIARPPRAWDLEELLELKPPKGAKQLLIALDGVQDPHNLGAIVRSAEFFGATGVFWARDRSVAVTPTVVRASAGATERLPLGQVTNLARALARAKELGFWVVGTVAEAGADLRRLAADGMPDALVLVLGSEGSGLRRLTRDSCDFLATIPGAGGVASLNVSAAAAVALATLCTPAPVEVPIERDGG